MTRIRDKVRLERHKHLLKGLYTRGQGLSIVLGQKGKLMKELLVNEGEVNSKVTVGRSNN